MNCPAKVDYCIVKNANWEAGVSFSSGFADGIDDPTLYEGVLVFREYQDDTATVYLTLTSPLEPIQPDVPLALNFEATPAQTSQLPDWDVVAYCDLRLKAGGSNQRLYNADVEVSE